MLMNIDIKVQALHIFLGELNSLQKNPIALAVQEQFPSHYVICLSGYLYTYACNIVTKYKLPMSAHVFYNAFDNMDLNVKPFEFTADCVAQFETEDWK